MFSPLVTFPALYTATLLMLAGSGLFTTYIGLRLTQEGAGDLWVGGLMAATPRCPARSAKSPGATGRPTTADAWDGNSSLSCGASGYILSLIHI